MWSKAMATESLEFELVAPPRRRCCCVAMFVLLSFFSIISVQPPGWEPPPEVTFTPNIIIMGFLWWRERVRRDVSITRWINKQKTRRKSTARVWRITLAFESPPKSMVEWKVLFFHKVSIYESLYLSKQSSGSSESHLSPPAQVSSSLLFVECVWTRSNQPERPDIALDEEASVVSRRYEIALTFYGI